MRLFDFQNLINILSLEFIGMEIKRRKRRICLISLVFALKQEII